MSRLFHVTSGLLDHGIGFKLFYRENSLDAKDKTFLTCVEHNLFVPVYQTRSLRQHFSDVKAAMSPYPTMFVDGPFGEGHQGNF